MRVPFFVFGLILVASAHSQARYPLIERPDRSDPLFLQVVQNVEQFHMAVRRGDDPPPLTMYRYEIRPGDTVLTVSARFLLPYSTIATVNRLTGTQIPPDVGELVIPTAPGIFVAQTPVNDLERIIASERDPDRGDLISVTVRDQPISFRYVRGEDFSAIERRAFLDALFRDPLPSGRITSRYGFRFDPFTGLRSFHHGVDISAPDGADVHAARDGRVIESGDDRLFGLYIIIEHEAGYTTFYGHLSEVLVELNARVTSGMIIGRVGSTGISTGPHLHFEVRVHGTSRDPLSVLPRRN